MKRRVVSLLLMAAMMISMATSALALNTDYSFHIEASDATLGSNSGLSLKLYAKGPKFASTQSILLGFDATKLIPVTSSGTYADMSAAFKANVNSMATISDEVNWENMATKPGGFIANITVIGGTNNDNSTYYIGVQPEFAGNYTAAAAGEKLIATFSLAFVGTTTAADIDKTSLWVLSSDEVNTVGQSEAAVATNGDDITINFNPADATANKDLTEPTLTLNGKALPAGTVAIKGITVTLGTTPAKVPTAAQGNQTVTATAAATPSGATLPTDVTWTVSPANKGVTVAADGKVTVTPSAAAGEYTVTAASASKGVSGNAKFTMDKDPAAVASFNLNKTTTSIKRGANETLSVKDIKDQYGAAASGTATWAVKTDNAGGKITVDTNGKVSVAADATVGNTAVISATINGIEKTCTVTVANLDNSNVTAINAANVKVGTDISASLNGAGNGQTITWSVVSGPATLKGSATGATATFTTTGEGTVRIQATQPDGATMKGFTLTKDVTVGGKDPSAKPTVNIAITGGTADGKVVAGEAVTLTANVSGAGVTEANCTYAWTKGGTPAGTGKTLSIAAFDPATDAVKYTCVVTHTQDADHSATVSDPAEITLSEKTLESVTVTAKTGLTSFKTGAVSSIKVSDLMDITPTAAKALVDANGSVKFYEEYEKTAAVPGTPAVGNPGDPDYVPEVPATPAVKGWREVTTLAAGKTYYAAVGVTAASNDTYTVSAITAPSAPTAEADLTNLITVTTRAASSGGGGGSSTTKYTVTYDAGEHGKLDGSATERVESGKNPTKVPSVVADKGYKFVGWTLNGKSVKPASTKITAATKFVAEYEAADKVTYIQGMDKNHFQPAGNATRGQLATMLARLSKDYDASKTYTGKAPDVENGKWYTNTVNFAINQGIMNGFEDGMFRPTENIRRGEFAAMLARYLGLNTSSKAHFADVTDHWAAGYINALADAGIVDGFEDGTFKAQNLLTRAEAVKMINLAVEMKYDEKADYDNSFVDVAQGAWYYEFVMPAANLDVTDYQR